MKSFIFAIILLSLILIGVIINSVATERIFSDISNLLTDLPASTGAIAAASSEQIEDYKEQLKKICNKWSEKKKIIALSIPHDEADKFTSTIVEATAFFKAGDYSNYLARLANAKQALRHLSDSEQLNLDNIL